MLGVSESAVVYVSDIDYNTFQKRNNLLTEDSNTQTCHSSLAYSNGGMSYFDSVLFLRRA
jgi:hypothetical protein